jgi:hypothetical protein
MLRGVNYQETENLCRETGIKVIASGGVTAIEDIRELWDRRSCGIEASSSDARCMTARLILAICAPRCFPGKDSRKARPIRFCYVSEKNYTVPGCA